jgi:methyl-accepting chemotaxis protein
MRSGALNAAVSPRLEVIEGDQAKPAQTNDESILRRAIGAMAERVGRLGIEAADIVGKVEDVTKRAADQKERLAEVVDAAQTMAKSNGHIVEATTHTQDTAAQVGVAMGETRTTFKAALDTILGLVDGVGQIEAKLPGLQESLSQVSKVARDIKQIAGQTNLLALNATIEAARAGDAGKGFAVVAGEVKALSRQTADAVTMIEATLAALSGQIGTLIAESQAAAEVAAAARSGTGNIGQAVVHLDRVDRDIKEVQSSVAEIAQAAAQNREECASIETEIGALDRAAKDTLADMAAASERATSLLAMSEDMISLTAEAGIDTVDTPFIDKCMETAKEVSRIFEEGIERGEISLDALFDTNYQQVPNVMPPHYLTRHTEFSARKLLPVLDRVVASSERILACTPGDMNNYYPIINSTFAKPPTDDPKWNAAHSRARTRQLDRTSLNMMTSDKPFLVQTYRRNMGDRFDLMKNVSAPIMVKGRRWGALRIMVKV